VMYKRATVVLFGCFDWRKESFSATPPLFFLGHPTNSLSVLNLSLTPPPHHFWLSFAIPNSFFFFKEPGPDRVSSLKDFGCNKSLSHTHTHTHTQLWQAKTASCHPASQHRRRLLHEVTYLFSHHVHRRC
jgi:hypothetical protein